MKKRNILIELTPLLDVVLLMLFFVLVQSQGRLAEIEEQASQAVQIEREAFVAALADAKEAFDARVEIIADALADELDALRADSAEFDALLWDLEQNAAVILITIETNPADISIRQIIADESGGRTAIALSWDEYERTRAAHELDALLARADDFPIAFVVFIYDSARVFDADYRLVRDAVRRRQEINLRLFYQGWESRG